MIKAVITEHDSDYHGAWCGTIEKEFYSVEQAKQWCIDNRDRPFSYILDSAYDKETKKKVY